MLFFKSKSVPEKTNIQKKNGINILPFTIRLCDVSKSIFNDSKQLISSSDELNNLSESISDSVNVNTNNMNIVEKSINTVADEIDSINKNSVNSKKISEENIQNITAGKESVTDSVKKIEDLASYYNNMFEIVNKLNSYSKNISNIAKYIDDISSKTKLLSLNASIEAARAGDAGRGFTVITKEIESLANQSADFSKEISNVLNEISTCVKAIEQESKINFDKIENTKDSVLNMWQILDNVSQSITSMDKNIDSTINGNNIITKSIKTGQDKIDILKDSFTDTTKNIDKMLNSINIQHDVIDSFDNISKKITAISEEQLDISLDKSLNEKLIEIGSEIAEYRGSKSETALLELCRKYKLNNISYSDKNGVFVYGSDKSSLGLNIFELDNRYISFMNSDEIAKPYPISRNFNTGELFKFMAIKRLDDKGVISVGFDLNTLIQINNSIISANNN